MWWVISLNMSRISLKSVVDSCGLSIAILISRIRFTSFILECTPVFTIFIWLKHCSTVAIPIGNFNKMSRRLKVFQQLVAYVFNVIISTFSFLRHFISFLDYCFLEYSPLSNCFFSINESLWCVYQTNFALLFSHILRCLVPPLELMQDET